MFYSVYVPYAKKIDKKTVYEIVSTEGVNSTEGGESGNQKIKVYLNQADYYERPWRN